MKTIRHLMVMVAGVFALGFAGCSHTSETTIETPAAYGTADAETYSSQDLSRTGKRTSADQLQAVDPSVTTH